MVYRPGFGYRRPKLTEQQYDLLNRLGLTEFGAYMPPQRSSLWMTLKLTEVGTGVSLGSSKLRENPRVISNAAGEVA